MADEVTAIQTARASTDPGSPWAIADGWRLGHAGERFLVLQQRGQRHDLHVAGAEGSYRVRGDGFTVDVTGGRLDGSTLSARFDGEARRYRTYPDAEGVLVHDGRRRLVFQRVPAFQFEGEAGAGSGNRVAAPMPGRIVVVQATVGVAVEEGQALLVMEAMKMELTLRAPRAGTVAEVRAAEGEFVEGDAVLVVLEE